MHLLEAYLKHLHEVRSTGGAVPETAYYPALSNLLDGIGNKLKPRVRCVSQLVNTGAGSPDFGLYAEAQFQAPKDAEPLPGQLPERGVVEVKGVSDDSWVTAGGKQVSKYWGHYGQVLVTNYRDFVLIGQDENSKPVKLEVFRIADSQKTFWAKCGHPKKTAAEQGDRLVQYLSRVMMSAVPLKTPEGVAWFLASYAREARGRIEAATDLPGLTALRTALEESLGLKFEGKEGEHFFRATLVQTLFYGVFSAWVLWAREEGASGKARFDWRTAAWGLHVPMIGGLFEQIATPHKLKPLGLDELLDWTGAVLNRVEIKSFFKTFEQEHAVQYFYEPFLKAYDPELRKQLGVWYTPREIVKYQVARVDRVLRDELKLADGLADPSVFVLDPCCGTGAYLVETLRKVHETLTAKGGALVAQKLKKIATERVFGFELLPAPFVVSHLQLGLLLNTFGAPLGEGERAPVFLTNSLTAWETPKEPKKQLEFPEMQDERAAADRVKQETPVLVVIGNPPYNAFAGTSPAEEQGLVEPYKQGLISEWGIKKFNLDDLYIRFFRVAERRITKTGRGVVSFISNYSWTSEPSFVVLRKRLLDGFDKLWIENLHGNRKISEYAPDGRTSETVFAMSGFSPGIRQGVVTSLWVKVGKARQAPAVVLFRDDINAARASERRAQLLDSMKADDFDQAYSALAPEKSNRYRFWPAKMTPEYKTWPRVVDLCAEPPSNGLMEKRVGALVDINRTILKKRIRAYFDPEVSWEALTQMDTGLTKDAARFPARNTRKKVLAKEKYSNQRLYRYAVRPFDYQWCYYSPVRPLWNEPRPALWAQAWEGNSFFLSRLRSSSSTEGTPCYFVHGLSDDHLIVPDASCFPLRLKKRSRASEAQQRNGHLFDEPDERADNVVANLSAGARAYLKTLGITDPDRDAETAGLIWMHGLSISYAPAYLSENTGGVQQDWPRIPLPLRRKQLTASAELGQTVAGLLDPDHQIQGITLGTLRRELASIGIIHRSGGGNLGTPDLDLTAGWGHRGNGGITAPGKGRAVEREYSGDETHALRVGAAELGLSYSEALARLGRMTRDIYLNDVAYWKNIPSLVWNYRIGGYQVIKKWLSYRENKGLLGRGLTIEEVEYVTEVARRIAAILLLGPALDANYKAAKALAYSWVESELPAGGRA